MNIKKFICSLLTVTTTVLGFQAAMIRPAVAAPVCQSYSANQSSAQCSSVRVGGTVMSFPKMQWSLVSVDATGQLQDMLKVADYKNLDHNVVSGNEAAALLGLQPSQVPSALSSFPANVPLVVGRYEPLSKSLHVDIFRIERQMLNGKVSNAVYHSVFSPAYGDYWKAAGTYTSADQRKAGAIGPNPFSAFSSAGSDDFSNITMKGAMVAIGHAQRYVGAPLSLLINMAPSTESYTKKSGGVFKKKVTQYVDYYVKPEYYVGAPVDMQGGLKVSYCANDPSSDSCFGYQVASSGVSFQKFEGGNMLEGRDFMHQWKQSKSGFTLLAIFAIVFVIAFAFAVLGPAVTGISGSAGGAGATSVVGAGTWTNILGLAGVGGTSAASAALIEAGLYTLATGATGSGFGGVYGSPTGMLFAQEKALSFPENLSHISAQEYRDKVVASGVIGSALDQSTPIVRQQVLGGCSSSSLLKDCTSSTGVVPRADTYTTFNSMEFTRDNGAPLRAGGF